MTWDWDKLQEKRQRQQGQRPSRPLFGDDNDTQDEQPRRARRSPSGNGGDGNGFDGRNALKKLSGMKMPGGMVIWLVLGLVGLWLLSGIYIVNPDEEGVVLRFGKYDRTEGPGPHYALPAPIETVYKPQVTQVLRCEVGFRSTGQATTFRQGELRSVPKEASMLTGDENIVNVQFSVQYKISDAVKYLFNISDPTNLVRNAAEAAMREVIGKTKAMLVAEECAGVGCMGQRMAAILGWNKISPERLELCNLGKAFPAQGTVEELYREFGLDAESLAKKAAEVLR